MPDKSTNKYKTIVADDYRISRSFFEMTVGGDPRFELLASFSDAAEALDYCRNNEVELVVMDILMRSGSDGLTVARQLKAELPDIKIVLATSAIESAWLESARRCGVESFWYKEYSKEPLLEVLIRTMAGESIYPVDPPNIEFGKGMKLDLTDRDLDVLREMMRGGTNEEIAARMGISANTVRTHIQNMLNKTGFKNRLSLVVHAASLGIVVNDQHRTRLET